MPVSFLVGAATRAEREVMCRTRSNCGNGVMADGDEVHRGLLSSAQVSCPGHVVVGTLMICSQFPEGAAMMCGEALRSLG